MDKLFWVVSVTIAILAVAAAALLIDNLEHQTGITDTYLPAVTGVDPLGNAQEIHARIDNASSCIMRGGQPLMDFDIDPPVYVVCL
jgi:hypothetical protein